MTAYEMRISDWSSDVCSSDLVEELARQIAARMAPDALLDAEDVAALLKCTSRYVTESYSIAKGFPKALRLTGPGERRSKPRWKQNGRAACRERGCQYV